MMVAVGWARSMLMPCGRLMRCASELRTLGDLIPAGTTAAACSLSPMYSMSSLPSSLPSLGSLLPFNQ